jgi:NAD(P)-dependent dehydrogenase (short-subunit alcohol dehydrogenase family)
MSSQGRPLSSGSSEQLAGKVVLVAASSGTLGEVLAGASSERGARVALATAGGGPRHPAVVGFNSPLETESQVDALFDTLPGVFSPPDVVIVVVEAEPHALAHQTSLASWRRQVETPLRRTFWLLRRAVEEMLSAGSGGRLVIAMEPAPPDAEPDEVVENALFSLVRCVAREYGRRGVACNLVSDGGDRSSGGNPVPSLIAHALYLASAQASFVNGEWLRPGPVRRSS